MALQLDDVTLVQGDFRLAADLRVAPGARVAVIGPSGAGKSTLLSLIAGFVLPTTGRVLWQGQDLAALRPGQRPVSILFQDQNLFPHLSVAQNVGLGLNPALRLTGADRDAVAAALDRVGLPDMADRRPAELSGGQQGRVALARALLRRRPVLLLDEPFAALGPALKVEMLDLVKDIAAEQGATLLMVSHDPADARRLEGEAILVAEGRAHPPVPAGPLLDRPPPALAAYLGT
ncbi:thiamine ABC transporter ATP-binding protein [Frigidibacter oleivorans]|uniref:thiamine ABC transporter ATP-binding protein n=1 Tax=Frigidibacter oleivorans TaxID=2487129 RepID=UPI000F8ED9B8|nr:thiamine ABC transporter ATP-binding protein [Frigidibacter oleivorans]